MGDRTWWHENCIHCGGKNTVMVYDAPSCLQWLKRCEKCDWSDKKDYYEISEQEIALLTKKELKELQKKDPKVKKFREKLAKLEQEQEI